VTEKHEAQLLGGNQWYRRLQRRDSPTRVRTSPRRRCNSWTRTNETTGRGIEIERVSPFDLRAQPNGGQRKRHGEPHQRRHSHVARCGQSQHGSYVCRNPREGSRRKAAVGAGRNEKSTAHLNPRAPRSGALPLPLWREVKKVYGFRMSLTTRWARCGAGDPQRLRRATWSALKGSRDPIKRNTKIARIFAPRRQGVISWNLLKRPATRNGDADRQTHQNHRREGRDKAYRSHSRGDHRHFRSGHMLLWISLTVSPFGGKLRSHLHDSFVGRDHIVAHRPPNARMAHFGSAPASDPSFRPCWTLPLTGRRSGCRNFCRFRGTASHCLLEHEVELVFFVFAFGLPAAEGAASAVRDRRIGGRHGHRAMAAARVESHGDRSISVSGFE